MKKNILILVLIAAFLVGGFFLWKSKPDEKINLRTASFDHLPGWGRSSMKTSLAAFQLSCKTFLRQDPQRDAGSSEIAMQVKDWQPACRAAIAISPVTTKKARLFFQKWFSPVEFYQNRPVEGLFTGYYSPLLKGSLKRTETYRVPLYNLPDNHVMVNLSDFDSQMKFRRIVGYVKDNKLVPYYERKAINQGAIDKQAKVIAWVDNPVDRQFLEIQGSGLVELDSGERIYVGYAGENGQPYTSLARVLIDKGVMTKDNASMQGIKRYLDAHPEEKKAILNQNKSFVFFRKLDQKAAFGAQGIALTPGYSLAIDRKWVPLGTPVWLNTTRPSPDSDSDSVRPLKRLMIAQDTGGAIRGAVRGDVYWGAGKTATYIAGHMKNKGHYWLLLPKHLVEKLTHPQKN